MPSNYTDEGFIGKRWGSAGAGILFTTGTQVLLLKRSPAVEEPGTWGIPGGAIPVSSTGRKLATQLAAIREAKEELGSLPRPYVVVDQHIYQEKKFTYTTFIAKVADPVDWEPILDWENTDWGWFTKKDLGRLHLHFGVVGLLQAKQNSMFFSTNPKRTAAFKRTSKAKILYHGTGAGRGDHILKAILREGLLPSSKSAWGGSTVGGVYWVNSVDKAVFYADETSSHFGGDAILVVGQVETSLRYTKKSTPKTKDAKILAIVRIYSSIKRSTPGTAPAGELLFGRATTPGVRPILDWLESNDLDDRHAYVKTNTIYLGS